MISLRSKITQAVLGYFFVHEGAAAYINELARKLSLDSGNLTRKLKELEATGILTSEMRGKETYYTLHKKYPLLKEYKKIVLKTVGFEALLRQSLQKISGIKHAYIYGSYAQNQMNTSSDIDLLIIGDHNTLEAQKIIAGLQLSLDREINVTQISTQESLARKKTDPFYQTIFKKPKIKVI